MSDKIGRNDPCPCGSGKKYKACCMLKQEQKMTTLKGRKFTAKVLTSGGMSNKAKDESQPDPEQVKAAVDYNRLMERSFGEALTSKEEKPDLVSKDADVEVEEKKGE